MTTGLERIAAKARSETKSPVYIAGSSYYTGTGVGESESDTQQIGAWM